MDHVQGEKDKKTERKEGGREGRKKGVRDERRRKGIKRNLKHTLAN